MAEFQLGNTATSYASGKRRYDLRRTDKPQVIAHLDIYPEQAIELRAQLARGAVETREGVEAAYKS